MPQSTRPTRRARALPGAALDADRASRLERAGARALLVVASPTLLMVPSDTAWAGIQAIVAPVGAVAVLAATLMMDRVPRVARWVATAGIVAPLAIWVAGDIARPAEALVAALVTMVLLTRLHPDHALVPYDLDPDPRSVVRPAAWLALVVTIGAWFRPWIDDPVASLGLVTAAAAPLLTLQVRPKRHPVRALIAFGAFLIVLALSAGGLVAGSDAPLRILPVLPAVALTLTARADSARDDPRTLLTAFLGHPPRLLVSSFAALCALGTLLLALPLSRAGTGPGLPFLDALFTAVSAACVTGLAVLDTPNDFSLFGQAVILLLIQTGGLGIMTFAAAAFVVLGRRLSVREETTAVGLLGARDRSDVQAALRRVFVVTFTTEAIGAAALTALFVRHGDTWGEAAWRGLFTSISAFCNAGFALQSDSLVPYQDDPAVLGVVGLLIVTGGLGPAVIAGLPLWWRTGRASLHLRLAVATTAVLIAVPAVGYAAFEWSNTLSHLPVGDRLANALFQSVTLRTAGFNSVDITQVQPATWTLMLAAMFVGGSPGSTAGGIKTTTAAVVTLELWATVTGRRNVHALGRRIPTAVVREAIAIVGVGAAGALGLLLALQLTQRMPLDLAFFEAMSALATVGLSIGGTAMLDDVGKMLITAAMFAGRVGPLTLLLLLQEDTDSSDDVGLPTEALAVG